MLEEIRNIINKNKKGHKNPDKCFNVKNERKNKVTGVRVCRKEVNGMTAEEHKMNTERA